MNDNFDDRALIGCFNVIYDLYPDSRRAEASEVEAHTPSLSENRDVLRLFSRIGSPELRTALRMLMRTLATVPTAGGPNGPDRLAANKPN